MSCLPLAELKVSVYAQIYVHIVAYRRAFFRSVGVRQLALVAVENDRNCLQEQRQNEESAGHGQQQQQLKEKEEEEKEKEKEVGKSHRGGRCCSAAWPTFADAAALVGGLTVALGRRRTATQPSSGPSWLGHPHAQRDNCCGCCCPPIFGRNGNGVVIVFRRLHDPIVSILVLFNGVRAADRHLAVLALPEPAGTASHGSAKEIQEGTGGGGEGSPFSLVG